MSTVKQANPFDVSVFDIGLKVFRVNDAFSLMRPSTRTAMEDTQFNIHTHFTYEVFFVTEGSLSLTVEKSTEVYERKILIVPPKTKHCSMPTKRGNYCLLFAFDGSSRPNRRQQFLEQLLQRPCCVDLTEDMAFYIRKLTLKNCCCTDPVSRQETVHLASLLFYELFSCLLPPEQVQPNLEKSNARHIFAIETYINSHPNQKILLADVAKAVSLSTRQVSRIILKEYNCSLSQLVLEKRLSAAEQLIRNSRLPIEHIALQSGIGSPNYFFSLFKKHYGVSPLQYRKQQKG